MQHNWSGKGAALSPWTVGTVAEGEEEWNAEEGVGRGHASEHRKEGGGGEYSYFLWRLKKSLTVALTAWSEKGVWLHYRTTFRSTPGSLSSRLLLNHTLTGLRKDWIMLCDSFGIWAIYISLLHPFFCLL